MINAEAIHKSFEDFTALDNVTCNISDGCIYGMVGSNGAGKSTFLRVLSGVYKPDKGYAFIDGLNVYENPKAKQKIVFVDDDFYFLPGSTLNNMEYLYDVEEVNSIVIVSSHSLRELDDICDHLALLHKGGMVLDSDVLELKTSQFKVQVAFRENFDKSRFEQFNITRYRQEGSVANMIINGDREETVALFKAMNPLVLDVLPLTLEEVFTYEMESLGYEFESALEVEK